MANKHQLYPELQIPAGGLNAHNVFDSDVSLTRNDYYLANGNNYELTLLENQKGVHYRAVLL